MSGVGSKVGLNCRQPVMMDLLGLAVHELLRCSPSEGNIEVRLELGEGVIRHVHVWGVVDGDMSAYRVCNKSMTYGSARRQA